MMDPFNRRQRLELRRGDVVFIGEGGDDCALIRELAKDWKHGPQILTRNDQDAEMKKLDWSDQFRILVDQGKTRRISGIGLMFDAEPDRKNARKTIEKMFLGAGLTCPRSQNHLCTQIRDGNRIKAAYLINPAKKRTGSLESLFRSQVDGSRIGPCIGDLLKCYEKRGHAGPANLDKLVVRTFLSYKNPSHTGLTVAIRDQSLKLDGPEFNEVKRFVKLLKPSPTELLDELAEKDG